MMGPMLVSAIAHLAGFTDSKPPGELVAAAQVVVGCGIGCRFVGTALDQLHKEIGVSVGAAVLLIGCAVAFAEITHALTGLSIDATVLSYAPGGFAEMSLIGLAPRRRGGDGGDPSSVPPVPDHPDQPVHLALRAHARTVRVLPGRRRRPPSSPEKPRSRQYTSQAATVRERSRWPYRGKTKSGIAIPKQLTIFVAPTLNKPSAPGV